MLKLFGPNFAKELFRLKSGSWQGPIRSGYGWHLAWIDEIVPGRVPDLAEVQPEVKTAWLEDQREEVRDKAFEAMRARYTVVLPPLDAASASLAADAAALAPGGHDQRSVAMSRLSRARILVDRPDDLRAVSRAICVCA